MKKPKKSELENWLDDKLSMFEEMIGDGFNDRESALDILREVYDRGKVDGFPDVHIFSGNYQE